VYSSSHSDEDYAKFINLLTKKARSLIRDLDPTSDLSFLRIKTRNEEFLVTLDKEFMLFAIQGPKYQKDRRDDEN
jgi:dynein light chain roadblock-type